MIPARFSRRNILAHAVAAISTLILAAPAQAGGADAHTAHEYQNNQRLVRRVQRALKRKGFDPGPIDGIWGPKTSAAVRAFERDQGLEVTGWLFPKTMDALLPGESSP